MYAFSQHFTLCKTIDQWVQCLRMAQEATHVAEDYETRPSPHVLIHKESALRPEQGALICGISLAWRGEAGQMMSCYVAFRHDPVFAGYSQPNPEQVLRAYADWCLERPADRTRINHNLAMEQAQNLRDRIPWPLPGQMQDTMIMARVLSRGVGFREQIGLKPLRDSYLPERGYDESKRVMDAWLTSRGFKPGADIFRAPPDIAGIYAAGDTCSTLELAEMWLPEVYRPRTSALGWWWTRGAPIVRPELTSQPLADLYELEVETALNGVLTSHRGNRFDFKKATKRTNAAKLLQRHCDAWICDYITRNVPDSGWIAGDKAFNPGSPLQVKRLLFGAGPVVEGVLSHTGLGLSVSPVYMSKQFKEKLGAEQQLKVLQDPEELIRYAALDIAAMGFYANAHPQHRDLLLMIGARRKMNTVMQWSRETPARFGIKACRDPWWSDSGELVDLIFHKLNTVLTISGRMSSSSYNGQNVSADKALLIEARVLELLQAFLSEDVFQELRASIQFKGKKLDFGIRCLFLARKRHRGRPIDLSQIEVRIFAGLTRNPKLCAGYGVPPTESQVRFELECLQRIGRGDLTVPEYLQIAQLDPLRHWTGSLIDAHSLVTSMTTDDAYVRSTGLSRAVFDDVLQLCAGNESHAVLRTLQGWEKYVGTTDLKPDEVAEARKLVDAVAWGKAEELIKALVANRKRKKSVTFGIMYGMGVTKLAISLGISYEEARDFIDNKYFAEFPEAKTLPWDIEKRIIERAVAAKSDIGYMQNRSGRRFYFKIVWSHRKKDKPCPSVGKSIATGKPCSACKMQAKGAYVAVNRFIQGDASMYFKLGYVRSCELFQLPVFGGGDVDPITRRPRQENFIMQCIHDENVASIHEEYDTAVTDFSVRSCMTLVSGVGVPLQTSSERYDVAWNEKEDVRYSSLT